MDPAQQSMADKFDDDDYPAYTMGRAAEMLGTTPDFLRSLDEAKLIAPQRSPGGHRRYSRYQLRLAARTRELVDQGTPWMPPAASSCLKTSLEKHFASTPRITQTIERATVPLIYAVRLGLAKPAGLRALTS